MREKRRAGERARSRRQQAGARRRRITAAAGQLRQPWRSRRRRPARQPPSTPPQPHPRSHAPASKATPPSAAADSPLMPGQPRAPRLVLERRAQRASLHKAHCHHQHGVDYGHTVHGDDPRVLALPQQRHLAPDGSGIEVGHQLKHLAGAWLWWGGGWGGEAGWKQGGREAGWEQRCGGWEQRWWARRQHAQRAGQRGSAAGQQRPRQAQQAAAKPGQPAAKQQPAAGSSQPAGQQHKRVCRSQQPCSTQAAGQAASRAHAPRRRERRHRVP